VLSGVYAWWLLSRVRRARAIMSMQPGELKGAILSAEVTCVVLI
jgi:hypothetical protein